MKIFAGICMYGGGWFILGSFFAFTCYSPEAPLTTLAFAYLLAGFFVAVVFGLSFLDASDEESV